MEKIGRDIMNIIGNLEKLNHEIETIKEKNHIKTNITILAATKYVGVEEIKMLVNSGIHNIGENKVQDFLIKYELLQSEPIIWHFIGSLQTNKVNKIINKLDYLHSLDRESLAIEINKQATKVIHCFVEVNCSGEENKHGLNPNEVISFIKNLEQYDKIKVVGLMTMAESQTDELIIRRTFARLKQIQEAVISLNLNYAPCLQLSMGMSNDFHYAILEGSTLIRIGSRLFSI
ncbi:MAG: hypothetical protein K0Q49_5 [Haloplasmataceae bacterium]|jgi:pyridoxal phosphate enzyme (YggS family)|nr:hypothetical protein [Haloplasmataceae bacterium]